MRWNFSTMVCTAYMSSSEDPHRANHPQSQLYQAQLSLWLPGYHHCSRCQPTTSWSGLVDVARDWDGNRKLASNWCTLISWAPTVSTLRMVGTLPHRFTLGPSYHRTFHWITSSWIKQLHRMGSENAKVSPLVRRRRGMMMLTGFPSVSSLLRWAATLWWVQSWACPHFTSLFWLEMPTQNSWLSGTKPRHSRGCRLLWRPSRKRTAMRS